MDTINKRIKYYRKKAGYLQSDMAQILNMKYDTYSKLERKGNIDCKTLIKLSDVLHINPLYILYNREEIILPNENEIIYKPVDLLGIPELQANDIYEKIAILAMRNFTQKRKDQLYQFILDEFKYIDNLTI